MENLEKAVKSLEKELSKGKKMPIGTVSKGRKKVAEGKWEAVKDDKKSNVIPFKKKDDEEKEVKGGHAIQKIKDYVVKNYPEKDHEKIIDRFIDVASGNKEGNEHEKRVLSSIFKENK